MGLAQAGVDGPKVWFGGEQRCRNQSHCTSLNSVSTTQPNAIATLNAISMSADNTLWRAVAKKIS
jgi:hypothetical protein